jgi:hypothetical protein
MEAVAGKIVINDNYDGILILDDDFNILKNIGIMEDFVADISFANNHEIVFCCYENRCLVYMDVVLYTFKVIPLQLFDKSAFLPFYDWKDDKLILLSENGNILYRIDLITDSVTVASDETISDREAAIRDRWLSLRNFPVHKVYPQKQCAIVGFGGSLSLFNYHSGIKTGLKIDPINFHDIEIEKDAIAQISEEKISVWYKGESAVLYPESDDCRFLRAKFIKIAGMEYLILLSCSNSDSSSSKLEKVSLATLCKKRESVKL